MTAPEDTQCYFIQLQIDGFLDGELSATQQESFMSHLHQCQECARELRYAQTVHDALLDLPQVDCDDAVLDPLYRPVGSPARHYQSPWGRVLTQLLSIPTALRYAVPVVAVLAMILLWVPAWQQQQTIPALAQQSGQPQVEQYSPEQIQQALEDLNVAIDYLNQVSQRTEAMIGDRFLITPLQESLNASLDRARVTRQDSLQDDPI